MGDQLKTILFAVGVCFACSLLLAGVYAGLEKRIAANIKDDLNKKVLTVFGEKVYDETGKQILNSSQVREMFDRKITGLVLDAEGNPTDLKVDDLTSEQVNKRNKKTGMKKYYPLYVYTDDQADSKRYAIYISGMGLWSIVKGYLAFESNLETIAGITFVENKETPGLGAEIDKPYFQKRFVGKTMVEDGKVEMFEIVKPGKPVNSHSVDGISGATMTCKGVTNFINSDFEVYNKYFETLRKH